MRNEIRRRHYSHNTEKSYIYWVRYYIFFHQKQHPKDLNKEHIEQFLTYLATHKRISGTTQAQALNALVFLYRQVLQIDVGDLNYLRNVRRFKNIPTVLGKDEVVQLFRKMEGTTKLMTGLLYGAGLRVNECVTLRVQDIDLSHKTITVRNSKGKQARVILIPQRLLKPLEQHLLNRRRLHINDLNSGAGHVELPNALARKYKNASTRFEWQYLFPSNSLRKDLSTNVIKRWHCSTSTLQKAIRKAVHSIQLNK